MVKRQEREREAVDRMGGKAGRREGRKVNGMDLRRVMAGRGEAEGASLRGRSASGLGSVGSLKPPVYPHIRFPYCGSSEPLRPFFLKSCEYKKTSRLP